MSGTVRDGIIYQHKVELGLLAYLCKLYKVHLLCLFALGLCSEDGSKHFELRVPQPVSEMTALHFMIFGCVNFSFEFGPKAVPDSSKKLIVCVIATQRQR